MLKIILKTLPFFTVISLLADCTEEATTRPRPEPESGTMLKLSYEIN
jgi:hypothetical protein